MNQANLGRKELRASIERLLELAEVAESAGMDGEGGGESVLRFGDVAVALGFVNRAQVWAALETQRLDREDGRPHRLVGKILEDHGLITPAQCAEVVDALAEVVAARRRDAVASPLVGRLGA